MMQIESTFDQHTIVIADHISREYQTGSVKVQAIQDCSLTIHTGEMLALQGRSGAGKTTLINILVGLDNPTKGEVLILGKRLHDMHEHERALIRRQHIGIMFQNAHLFPTLTAQENVEIPLRLLHVNGKERAERAKAALEQVGLGGRIRHRAVELSGGEQQRVALARALVHQPRFIVADEPTGNLDSMTAQTIAELMRTIAHQQDIGMLIATHDHLVSDLADHLFAIHDGQITQMR